MLMGQGDALMAFPIGLTMICTVVIAKVVGCTLPLTRKEGRSGPGDHGDTSDFYTCRYQHDQLYTLRSSVHVFQL